MYGLLLDLKNQKTNNKMSNYIKAPYNFVPVEENVFYPAWSQYLSHDAPFSDGKSGYIEVEIEAKQPIFVADGRLGQRAEGQKLSFFSHEGKYMIPGSSFKGMLRAVVEVMSYGKLGIFNQHQFAFRDLNNKPLYMNRIRQDNRPIQAGWLQKQDDGRYLLRPCGEPGRISFRDIDSAFGTDMTDYFVKGEKKNRLYDRNKDEHKAARFKYETFSQIGAAETTHTFVPTGKGYTLAGDNDPRGMKGVLVFTGQPGLRQENTGRRSTGKGKEFIFFETGRAEIEVGPEVIKGFKQAYFDYDENRQTVDWKYWSKELKKGERIPVFYNTDGVKEVAHLGLSYLYKLPYDYGVADLDPSKTVENFDRLDMAECIFGWVPNAAAGDKSGYQELKGRVQVGHLKAVGNPELRDKSITAVLSSPKASYYPNYIAQHLDLANHLAGRYYNTYNNKGAHISGRKRYPLRTNSILTNKGTDKVSTGFHPLKASSQFKGRIYFHNLREVELGAILSALTFHDSADQYWHQIGMGKPLGLGAIQVNAKLFLDGQEAADAALDAMGSFEACMLQHDANWLNSASIVELLSMAKANLYMDDDLGYMVMDQQGRQNHFKEAKNKNEGLNRYSILSGEKEGLLPLGRGEAPAEFGAEKDKLSQKIQEQQKQLKDRREQLYALLAIKKEQAAREEKQANRLREEAEAKEKERQKRAAEIAAKQAEIAANQAAIKEADDARKAIKREQAAQKGLDPVKEKTQLGKVRTVVSQFIKASGEETLAEEYWEELKENLAIAYSNSPKGKQREWKKKLAKELSNWLGDSTTAENWAKEILG